MHHITTTNRVNSEENRGVTYSLLLGELGLLLLAGLLLRLALLEESLWDEDLLLGWDGTALLVSLGPDSL